MMHGEVYGHLTVLRPDPSSPTGRGKSPKWFCRCDCGRETSVRKADLLSGNSRSCGCGNYSAVVKHGRYKDSIYRIYYAMRQRCENPKTIAYANYGGRGIKVCERWRNFASFLEDMGERPSDKHGLDRIDGSKGYSPDNVRWATQAEQMQNIRTNVNVTAAGKTQTLGAWSRETGIAASTLQQRVAAGWDHERVIIPPKPRKRRH